MSNIWVLVAESSRAKIFQTDDRLDHLDEVDDLVHVESRLHEHNLTSDLPGRRTGGGQLGSHHVMDEQTDIKENEAIRFAKELDEQLEDAMNQGRFDRLALIAPPHFLGLLRKNMSKGLSSRVSHEVNKNLIHSNSQEIREHLPFRL